QKDIVVGTPVANRQRSEVEHLIGFFVNTLALRVNLEDEPSVAQLLARTKACALSAYDHQDLPFDQVVEALKPERSLSHSPIFQAMLVMDNTPELGTMRMPGVSLEEVELPHVTTQFDLSLSLRDNGETLEGDLEYASDLFEAATVERLMRHFAILLEGMAADDQVLVSRLPLLDDAQRRRLLVDFNDTAHPYPDDPLLHQLFEDQVERQPDAEALVCGEQRFSYRQLNARANQLAHFLIGMGVGPDDRVAICVERSPEMIIGLLGILKAGGAYVPLDPAYPAERLTYMLKDSGAVALLTTAPLGAAIPGADVTQVRFDDHAEALARQASDNPDSAPRGLVARHMAYVLYTSGSTGLPKGVMVEHRNVVNLVRHHRQVCAMTAADRVLQLASFGFDNSIAEIFPALSVGAAIVLRPPHLVAPDSSFIAFLREHRITVTDLPTAFWHQWAQEIKLGRALPPEGLRFVAAGGEKAELRHLAAWFAEPALRRSRWLNTYGPTEAAVNSTVIAYDGNTPLPPHEVPIGSPIANARIYILDPHGQPVPIGVAGEIHIGGAGVARGYLNRPELTAEKFVADPFVRKAEARMYKTGDLGRWLADGNIEYLGRIDFQVKIRGFRIELGEIEARLAACAGVREAVVLAREDVPGDKRLVAYVTAHDGCELNAAELRAQLQPVLPDYMVPSAFVTLDKLPLNTNGKLDRKALPAPDGTAYAARAYEAPQGEAEQAVAAIWQELLGVEQVGRQDDFFELGGHSLLAVQLVSRLRQALGVEVALR
ncbi:MAG TPA: amino acid adenylation domain-containing protein, partial [Paucimonas sp.]|nr:amino acid adenylation domain-containing protein [Paucimonas sp.]